MFSSVCTPDACNSSPPIIPHVIVTGLPILASAFITSPPIATSSVTSFDISHVRLNGLLITHLPTSTILFQPAALSISFCQYRDCAASSGISASEEFLNISPSPRSATAAGLFASTVTALVRPAPI